MDEETLAALEEALPSFAVAALNAAHQQAVSQNAPRVVVIDDALYRISSSGGKELIRKLEPRVTTAWLENRAGA